MFNKQAGVYAQPQPYNPKAQDWKTLAEALPEGFPIGLPAAGRLDAETEGLVLFSDNRWLLHLLSQGTAGKASKSYHVWCSRVRGEGEGKEQDNADRYSGAFGSRDKSENASKKIKLESRAAAAEDVEAAHSHWSKESAAADSSGAAAATSAAAGAAAGSGGGNVVPKSKASLAKKKDEAKKAKKKLDSMFTEIRRAMNHLKDTQTKREVLRGKSKTQRQKELRAKASRIEREERKRKAQEEEGKWSSELAVLRAPLKYQNGIVTRPADDVTFLRAEENETAVFEVTISEGRNHQVRRLCAAAGLKVNRLVRTAIGSLQLGGLEPGEARGLTPEEVAELYGGVGFDGLTPKTAVPMTIPLPVVAAPEDEPVTTGYDYEMSEEPAAQPAAESPPDAAASAEAAAAQAPSAMSAAVAEPAAAQVPDAGSV